MRVEYIDHMGNDNSVVDAARVSFAKTADNYTAEQNHKLIHYLAEHKHEIPFAHTAVTLRMYAPISIRTQVFKHKIGFVENEVSRRYVKDKPELFLPVWRKASPTAKQGSLDEQHEDRELLDEVYSGICHEAIETYMGMIDKGVPPEQARFILPQGVYTEWVWTGSLLALARFYNLRSAPYAQKEIRELADMVSDVVKPLFPVAWEALTGVKYE